MGTFGIPSSYNNTGALGSATNPTTAQGLSRDRENQKAILELPGTQAWVEKTITDGVIVPTSAEIIVLPEGGASTDLLTTIALTSDGTTTLHDGMLIRLKAANSNTITVVHGAGTNNISTIDGNNIVLDTTWYLELKLIGGLWVQQENNAYRIAATAATAAASAQSTANTAVANAATAQSTANTASTNATNAASAADKATIKIAASTTADATVNKVATCSGFELSEGARIKVTFSNANTVADAVTLNVNSTGAKTIYNSYGATSTTNPAYFSSGIAYDFTYDGTHWVYHDASVLGPVLSTISAAGTWTITGCRIGVPLEMQLQGSTATNDVGGVQVRPLSGVRNSDLNGMVLGLAGGSTRPNTHWVIPTSDTVQITVYNMTTSPTCYLRAYQRGV